MLESDGYIYSTVGRGSFISEQLGQKEAAKIQVKQDLEKAVKNAYKHGFVKDEVIVMVQQIYEEAEK